jgi:uncharacterized protein (DUF58 family)
MSPATATRRRGVFPLVPRRRLAGAPFGDERSRRRGRGSDVAGQRPYVPGDPVATIDWRASARLSSARGGDEFVVRTHFAQEAPRVVLVCDRRPSMAVYEPPFPWLQKRAALSAAAHAILESAVAARADIGYLDLGEEHPFWLSPGSRSAARLAETRRLDEAPFTAPDDSVARALEFLAQRAADVPTGSFVFVLSDFLGATPRDALNAALASRWDVVPVVIQDPVWEQSFPDVAGVVLPVVDPDDGRVVAMRFTRGEVQERRRAHAARLRDLLVRFSRLGLDPVVLGTSDPRQVVQAFLGWAERRRQARVSRA